MDKVLAEDKAVVERLRPEAVRSEVSLGTDLPQVSKQKNVRGLQRHGGALAARGCACLDVAWHGTASRDAGRDA